MPGTSSLEITGTVDDHCKHAPRPAAPVRLYPNPWQAAQGNPPRVVRGVFFGLIFAAGAWASIAAAVAAILH